METMKLEQLIQATSGLSNRKETPIFANGEPIAEIRISIKDGAQTVDLVTGDAAEGLYDVRCAFDEEHNQWLYVISMPEKDKKALEALCAEYKIIVGDLLQQFYQWIVQEPEKAAQWLRKEG